MCQNMCSCHAGGALQIPVERRHVRSSAKKMPSCWAQRHPEHLRNVEFAETAPPRNAVAGFELGLDLQFSRDHTCFQGFQGRRRHRNAWISLPYNTKRVGKLIVLTSGGHRHRSQPVRHNMAAAADDDALQIYGVRQTHRIVCQQRLSQTEVSHPRSKAAARAPVRTSTARQRHRSHALAMQERTLVTWEALWPLRQHRPFQQRRSPCPPSCRLHQCRTRHCRTACQQSSSRRRCCSSGSGRVSPSATRGCRPRARRGWRSLWWPGRRGTRRRLATSAPMMPMPMLAWLSTSAR